jgi:hypothetical protein
VPQDEISMRSPASVGWILMYIDTCHMYLYIYIHYINMNNDEYIYIYKYIQKSATSFEEALQAIYNFAVYDFVISCLNKSLRRKLDLRFSAAGEMQHGRKIPGFTRAPQLFNNCKVIPQHP